MKTAFFHDGPLNIDINGNHHNGVLNDKIIDRYFFFTDELIVATRSNIIKDENPVSIIKHENVSFVELPNLGSIKGQFSRKKECKKRIKEVVKNADFIIARVPSLIGGLAIYECKKQGKYFITEVVGCPWDSYRSHSILGKMIAPIEYLKLRRQVAISPLVMYVTSTFLQKRYPTKGDSIGCSDVFIETVNSEDLSNRINRIKEKRTKFVIGTCGIVDVKYKGQEHVIKAIQILKNKGIEIEYQLIGPGNPDRVQRIAIDKNVSEQLHVLGPVSHEEVFKWLDEIDIYIQPSDTEGLCRALIEALSRGCPCIASNVGGNPELVNEEYLFSKGDYRHLAELIEKLYKDKNEMIKESKCNFERSKNYDIEILKEKRNSFYNKYIVNSTDL